VVRVREHKTHVAAAKHDGRLSWRDATSSGATQTHHKLSRASSLPSSTTTGSPAQGACDEEGGGARFPLLFLPPSPPPPPHALPHPCCPCRASATSPAATDISTIPPLGDEKGGQRYVFATLRKAGRDSSTPPTHPRSLPPSPPSPPSPLFSLAFPSLSSDQRQGYIDRLELILFTNIRPWWLGNHVLDLENGTV